MTKKQRLKHLRGCPRCGGAWEKVSGFYRCTKCQHVYNSQHMEPVIIHNERYITNKSEGPKDD